METIEEFSSDPGSVATSVPRGDFGGVNIVDRSLISVPLELVAAAIKDTELLLDRKLLIVTTYLVKRLIQIQDRDLAKEKLHRALERLYDIKNELESIEAELDVHMGNLASRLAELRDEPDLHTTQKDQKFSFDTYRRRVSWVLGEYLSKKNFSETLALLVREEELEPLVDLDLLKRFYRIKGDLERHSIDSALEWAQENEAKLAKIGSTLLHELKLQEVLMNVMGADGGRATSRRKDGMASAPSGGWNEDERSEYSRGSLRRPECEAGRMNEPTKGRMESQDAHNGCQYGTHDDHNEWRRMEPQNGSHHYGHPDHHYDHSGHHSTILTIISRNITGDVLKRCPDAKRVILASILHSGDPLPKAHSIAQYSTVDTMVSAPEGAGMDGEEWMSQEGMGGACSEWDGSKVTMDGPGVKMEEGDHDESSVPIPLDPSPPHSFLHPIHCSPYSSLFGEERWRMLVHQFEGATRALYGFSRASVLESLIQAGFSAIKSKGCRDCKSQTCPACLPEWSSYVERIPTLHKLQSILICPITGTIMDYSNPPLASPDGYVLSKTALDILNRNCGNNDLITCPKTNKKIHTSEFKRIFIM